MKQYFRPGNYLAHIPVNVRLGKSAMAELQLGRLHRLLQAAGRDVPYFRDLFNEAGFDPSSVDSLEAFESIPVSSKADLQALPESLLISDRHDPERLILRNTTGSTGLPFKIYRTWSEERILGAYRRRAFRFNGLRLRDVHVDLEEIEPRDPNDNRHFHELLMRLGFFRQYRVDATFQPESMIRTLEGYDPQVITGYSASLALLAQWMLENERFTLKPRFVAVHSEVLTAQMRSQVERAFRCPIYVIYDANECNLIASECPETGHLHVCDDSVLVEVVRDGRSVAPGEEGEVLITSLYSFAQPFIRFKIGDLATRGYDRCPCGAPFSTIKEVHGRMYDYFPLKDGRMLHPYRILKHLGDKNSWIGQYRLVQENEDLVRLYVVPAGTASEEEIAAIHEGVSRELGQAARFEVAMVDRLENDGRGKFRVCVSRLASEYLESSRPEAGRPATKWGNEQYD